MDSWMFLSLVVREQETDDKNRVQMREMEIGLGRRPWVELDRNRGAPSVLDLLLARAATSPPALDKGEKEHSLCTLSIAVECGKHSERGLTALISLQT